MSQIDPTFDETRLTKEAMPVLRHLAEPGAILAIAEGMDLAVVVQDNTDGAPARRATVSRDLAQAMALKEWIACDAPSHRVSRYRLTHQGRGCLREMVAARDNSAGGFAEGQAQFLGASPAEARRTAISDSPLAALARRKDKDGKAFLDRDLVRAGERLREDFELSQIGPQVGQNWGHFLTAGVQLSAAGSGAGGSAAKARLSAALAELGPGLGDVALRCCCQLEGLESAEKRMGWSARSGKIVLRIALQHLARHYAHQGSDAEMIG